jgi:predicted enzyme related to lactoylglutathione lyase
MKRVTGIGGIFFKAQDPQALRAWYARHLGFEIAAYGGTEFRWATPEESSRDGRTVWGVFPEDTAYFDPSDAPFMINYRVADLDALLAALREEGCEVEDRIEELPEGRFGWVMDPEGNRLELWEPPPVTTEGEG